MVRDQLVRRVVPFLHQVRHFAHVAMPPDVEDQIRLFGNFGIFLRRNVEAAGKELRSLLCQFREARIAARSNREWRGLTGRCAEDTEI